MTEFEDIHEQWRFPGPTTRLARNGFAWGLPPRSPAARYKWEREADRILGEAHERLGKDGAVWDAEGNRVWSLDQFENGNGGFPGPDVVLDESVFDTVDGIVAVAALEAALSPAEIEIVTALAEGTRTGVYGWTEPMAARFGKAPATIRQTWSAARKKLRRDWATEPERRERARLRSSTEGNGHTLFVGRPRSWGRRVDPQDAAEALARHALRRSSRDWRYERSLTDDGWQLHDDNLWSDWTRSA